MFLILSEAVWQRTSYPEIRNPQTKQQRHSVDFSPQTKYTDWATATCWRNVVPTFADRWVSRGQRSGSLTAFNLSFLDRSRYFSSKYLLIYPHKGWVDPVPDPLLLRKSGSAVNRTRDLWVSSQERWPLDHRGGHQKPTPDKKWKIGPLAEIYEALR
jgi:hypothetical protein